jgi:myo-inositol-1(or 4)-monophosphatase
VTDENPQQLLGLALEVAAEAQGLILRSAARTDLAMTRKSSATDLVTEIDHAVEALIVDRLLEARPDDGVLGEEGGDRVGHSGVRWVIDPIDGTTNFVYRIPSFAVSIAAVADGVALAGVVAIPSLGETFAASRGGGARCNGEPIAVSGETDLRLALVATGFSYDSVRRGEQGRVVAALLPGIRDIRRMGAASVDLCSVACGRVDGYYETGLAPWDHAAGALIASEAGAVVSDLHGGVPSAASVVAAPPALHRMLRDAIIAAGG